MVMLLILMHSLDTSLCPLQLNIVVLDIVTIRSGEIKKNRAIVIESERGQKEKG